MPDSCRLLSHHDAVRLSTVPFDHQFQSKPHRNSFFLPLDGSHFEVSSRFPCCVHQPLHSRLRGICLTHRPGSILCPSVPIFVRHGRVLSLYPLKPEDNQKGCFRTLACVLLSCASHPVEVTASVDIYPSRIVTSILFSRCL